METIAGQAEPGNPARSEWFPGKIGCEREIPEWRSLAETAAFYRDGRTIAIPFLQKTSSCRI
jgi:hypothetical protein